MGEPFLEGVSHLGRADLWPGNGRVLRRRRDDRLQCGTKEMSVQAERGQGCIMSLWMIAQPKR